jgi:O-antigen/teichoic acid export membrane protein
MFKRASESFFAQSVAKLAGGTAVGQALGVLVLPLLTRLYSPAEFGVAAAFVAALGMLSTIVTLRYHLAIPLPEEDFEAARVFFVAILLACSITLLLVFIIFIFINQISNISSFKPIKNFIWLLPLGVFLTAIYSSCQYVAIRDKKYGLIAKTKITQTWGSISTQIALGYLNAGALGLIIGQIVSNGAGVGGLIRKIWSSHLEVWRKTTWEQLKKTAALYKQYPIFSTPESLANSAALQVPMLLIALYLGSAELGFLAIVNRILQAPMSLIGTAVGQVYFGQSREHLNNKSLYVFTKNTAFKLCMIGSLVILPIAVLAPFAATKILGSEWHRVGTIIIWMAPYFLLQFIASPLSVALHVTNNNKLALIIQLSGLSIRIAAVYIFQKHAMEAFAIGSFIFYALYLIGIFKVTKDR